MLLNNSGGAGIIWLRVQSLQFYKCLSLQKYLAEISYLVNDGPSWIEKTSK